MIANDRQYQQTSKKATELERLLASIHDGTAGDDGFRDLQADALQSQLDDLRVELAEYDELRSGAMTTFESPTLLGLADALIKANKRFDMVILPGKRHGYADASNYFFWVRADYFSRWLIGDSVSSVDMVELNKEKEQTGDKGVNRRP